MYLRKSGNFQECWYPKTSLQITDENALFKFEIRFWYVWLFGDSRDEWSQYQPSNQTYAHARLQACKHTTPVAAAARFFECTCIRIMPLVQNHAVWGLSGCLLCPFLFLFEKDELFLTGSGWRLECVQVRGSFESWREWVSVWRWIFPMGSDVSHVEWEFGGLVFVIYWNAIKMTIFICLFWTGISGCQFKEIWQFLDWKAEKWWISSHWLRWKRVLIWTLFK